MLLLEGGVIMSFGENLQAIRKKNQLSQEALAEMLGVSRQAVSKWELGEGYPEVDKLLILSKKLNISAPPHPFFFFLPAPPCVPALLCDSHVFRGEFFIFLCKKTGFRQIIPGFFDEIDAGGRRAVSSENGFELREDQ